MIFWIIWLSLGYLGIGTEAYLKYKTYQQFTLSDLLAVLVFGLVGPLVLIIVIITRGDEVVLFRKKK